MRSVARAALVSIPVAAALVLTGCSSGAEPDGSPPEDRTADDPVVEAGFGFGAPATPAEIAGWDVDVGPDGEGLPPGGGDAVTGAPVYAQNCARCHGPTGVEGPNDVLVAVEPRDSFPFGRRRDLTTAIGNYWPYATTVFDYVRRAMPLETPGSLTDDEVYAVTAWLLWRNGLIEEDEVMNATSLPLVSMPARPHFVPSEDVDLRTLP